MVSILIQFPFSAASANKDSSVTAEFVAIRPAMKHATTVDAQTSPITLASAISAGPESIVLTIVDATTIRHAELVSEPAMSVRITPRAVIVRNVPLEVMETRHRLQDAFLVIVTCIRM